MTCGFYVWLHIEDFIWSAKMSREHGHIVKWGQDRKPTLSEVDIELERIQGTIVTIKNNEVRSSFMFFYY